MAKETIKEMIKRIVKEERGYERISTESALNKNPIHPQWENKKYKIVRMAYDDEGTNVFVLVDKMGKKIVSYSITGRSEFAKFQELSKRIKSDSVKESISKKRRSIKESAMTLQQAKELAKKQSKENGGAVQHVNDLGNGSYEVSDWYDDEQTVWSCEGNREL